MHLKVHSLNPGQWLPLAELTAAWHHFFGVLPIAPGKPSST